MVFQPYNIPRVCPKFVILLERAFTSSGRVTPIAVVGTTNRKNEITNLRLWLIKGYSEKMRNIGTKEKVNLGSIRIKAKPETPITISRNA